MTNQQLRAKVADVKCPRCGGMHRIRPLHKNGKVWYCAACDMRFYVGEVETT